MTLFQNQTFRWALAFLFFSNALTLNKYFNGMHWMNGFVFATHGLVPFTLTVITLFTLVVFLIYAWKACGYFMPQMNLTISLFLKLILVLAFGFVLTEFSRVILTILIGAMGLSPYAGYNPNV